MSKAQSALGVLRSHKDRSFSRRELAHTAAAVALALGLERRDGRVQPLSGRGIRYYQSLELVDPPRREGRDGVYGYLHLLQVIALRRFQSDGYELSAVAELARSGRISWHSEAILEDAISTAAGALAPASEASAPVGTVRSRGTSRRAAAEGTSVESDLRHRVLASRDADELEVWRRLPQEDAPVERQIEVSMEIVPGIRLVVDPATVPRHEQLIDQIVTLVRSELAAR